MRRLLLVAALIANVVGPASAGAAARTSLLDVEDEVMCPVCGTTLNLAQSPQAERERAFIRALIARGQSKPQVKRALVAQYGPQVLATPRPRGFDLAAYLVPLGVGAAALAMVALALLRWRGPRDPPLPEREPLAASDAVRLDEDLARYER